MKIGIITGASAGLGTELAKFIPKYYPEIEELWLISRRREKLLEAAEKTSAKCRIIPLDLTKDDSYTELAKTLQESGHTVHLLVNNSGCGYLGNVGEGPLENQIRTVDLNIKGLTAITHAVIPYMTENSAIINISSIASFCPNPRMTVYSASKAYVTAFSLGLGEELKERKISVTAVCSGPMDTEFIVAGGIKGHSKTFDILPFCDPEKVAKGALMASKKGRSIYTPRLFYKLYRVIAKIIPVKLMMKFAKT